MSKKLIVAVDLDGVLADYSRGWKGIHEFSDPLPGAIQFTHDLGTMYEVYIYSCRCSPSAHAKLTGVWESKEYLAAPVVAWLSRWGFYWDVLYQGCGKPLASAYIDDNAFRCTPMSDPEAYRKILSATTRMVVPPEKPPVGVQSSVDSPDPVVQGLIEHQNAADLTQTLSPSRTVTSRPGVEAHQAMLDQLPSLIEQLFRGLPEPLRRGILLRDPVGQSESTVRGE